jgi:hypothetical protein
VISERRPPVIAAVVRTLFDRQLLVVLQEIRRSGVQESRR